MKKDLTYVFTHRVYQFEDTEVNLFMTYGCDPYF